MLRRIQSLRRRTWHKMVGRDLEYCLIIVHEKSFYFVKSFPMFCCPFKIILLSKDVEEWF